MATFYGTNGPDTWSSWISGAIGEGTDDPDMFFGYDGDDWIDAEGGNDFIVGGRGADTIFGGDGVDTVSYADSWTGVVITFTKGGQYGTGYGGTAEGDLLFDVENVTGSWYGDYIGAVDRDNVVTGLSGDDTLE